MIATKHLLKVSAAWISVVWTVCFFGVSMFPGIRPGFMMYGFHTMINIGQNVSSLTAFVYGLIIWNVVTLLGVGLFAYLYNNIKK